MAAVGKKLIWWVLWRRLGRVGGEKAGNAKGPLRYRNHGAGAIGGVCGQPCTHRWSKTTTPSQITPVTPALAWCAGVQWPSRCHPASASPASIHPHSSMADQTKTSFCI